MKTSTPTFKNPTSQKPIVLFVPHYKARKKHLRRHVDFMKTLGFESQVFEPTIYDQRFKEFFSFILNFGKTPSLPQRWGLELKHWIDSLNLNHRPLIFFTFSAPSFMILNYMFRFKDPRVKGWICEGGPFGHFIKCLINYMTYAEGMTFWPQKLLHCFIGYTLWGGFRLKKRAFEELENFPSHIPILSLRGKYDVMTPPFAIEALFSPHKHLNIRSVTLDCRHLKGLKECPEFYKKEVLDFLKKNTSF